MNDTRHYTYAIATPANLSGPSGANTLGIEVTDPALAAACGLGNVDPQHGDRAAPFAPAALEACLGLPLPPRGARLVTIRPDADAIGAMALLELRASGRRPDEAMRARIAGIAATDRHDRGRWPGPRPLPDRRAPLAEGGPEGTAAVLGVCAADRAVSLEDRVGAFMRYLSRGTLPAGYKVRLAESAERLMRSLDAGATRVTSVAGGRIAIVISLEPAALRLGYRLAPVVVALNPAWRFPSGDIGRKYTVACWHEDDGDLTAFGERIAALEPGWGGQHGIKGSPQDRPSRLTVEQIVRLLDDTLGLDRVA